jgi:hypothetical protein
MYKDTQEVEDTKLLAIARSSKELCTTLIYPSVLSIEKESIRNPLQMAIVIRSHNFYGDIMGIVQLEYVSNTGEEGQEGGGTESPRAT